LLWSQLTIKIFLTGVFEKAILRGTSDIHFSVGRKPTLRVDGNLEEIDEEAVLQDKDTRAIGETILTKEQYERFAIERELDFSYSYQGKARFPSKHIFSARRCWHCFARYIRQC